MQKFFAVLVVALAAGNSFGQATNQQKALPSGFQSLVQDAKTRVKEIDIERFKALTKSGGKLVLIDVREDNEWSAGHAIAAIHISKGVIERDIEARVPQKDARLVLYCGTGSRSLLAADSLMRMGYTNVWSLSGGMKAYQTAGLAIGK